MLYWIKDCFRTRTHSVRILGIGLHFKLKELRVRSHMVAALPLTHRSDASGVPSPGEREEPMKVKVTEALTPGLPEGERGD